MIRAKSLETTESDLAGGVAGGPPSPSPSQEIPKKVSPPIPPTTASGRMDVFHFDQWWNQYLKKVGKKKAKAEYLRIVKRGEATTELLLAGLLRYNQSRDVRRGFIANPTTWLNQGRWDDGPDHGSADTGDNPIMEAIRNG
jgi:hypothetical protein